MSQTCDLIHYLVSFLSVHEYGLMELDLREIGLGCVDWIRLAQDRDRWRSVVIAVMNLRILAPRS
jgi:hypothetical protein